MWLHICVTSTPSYPTSLDKAEPLRLRTDTITEDEVLPATVLFLMTTGFQGQLLASPHFPLALFLSFRILALFMELP